MPFLRLTIGRPLDSQHQQRLANRLTRLVGDLLGKRREVTTVLVECIATEGWSIGGEAVAGLRSTPVHVEICITAGSNSDDDKARLLAATWAMLGEETGELAEASYIVIRELPAGDWGYGGQTQAARRLGKGPL